MAGIVIIVALLILIGMAMVYAFIFDPEEIEDEEVRRLQKKSR